jgi:hypothetical protein
MQKSKSIHNLRSKVDNLIKTLSDQELEHIIQTAPELYIFSIPTNFKFLFMETAIPAKEYQIILKKIAKLQYIYKYGNNICQSDDVGYIIEHIPENVVDVNIISTYYSLCVSEQFGKLFMKDIYINSQNEPETNKIFDYELGKMSRRK